MPLSFRVKMPRRLRDNDRLDAKQALWFRESKPGEELYDTLNDPHEFNNLAGDPDYKDKLEELRNEAEHWMAATGDKGFVPEAELANKFWPGGVQPKTAVPNYQWRNGRLVVNCETPGASIGYRIVDNAGGHDERWQVYTAPINLEEGESLVAKAHRLGYKVSEASSITKK